MLSKIRDCPSFKKGFIDFNVDNMHPRSGLFFSFSGVGTQIIITSISLTLEKSLVTEKMPELINFEILYYIFYMRFATIDYFNDFTVNVETNNFKSFFRES